MSERGKIVASKSTVGLIKISNERTTFLEGSILRMESDQIHVVILVRLVWAM
jgi:hypothetical protein